MKPLLYLAILLIYSCSQNNDESNSDGAPSLEESNVEILMDRNDVIWGFDFLPDEEIIFTERSGKMFISSDASVIEVTGVPNISTGGEGGLLDIKLHPEFASNGQVYFCYTASGRSHALARRILNGSTLTQVEELFRSSDSNSSSIHFGCRIEFQNSNQLFLSIGDQNEPGQAQNLNSHLGKILRFNDDGTIPPDNPFVDTPNARPEIWSYGHRNPQGLALDPASNQLYSSEHGPTGGDELNLIIKGQNYGWPLVTSGSPAGELGSSAPGFTDPLISWTPAIAPAGITFSDGRLFIATLRGEHIRSLDVNSDGVASEELFLENQDTRFRNVRLGPDGRLYFSTDDGKIGRF